MLSVTIKEGENLDCFSRAMSNCIKHGRAELGGVNGSSVAIVVVGGSMRTRYARKELVSGLDLASIVYVQNSDLSFDHWYDNHPFNLVACLTDGRSSIVCRTALAQMCEAAREIKVLLAEDDGGHEAHGRLATSIERLP